MPFKIYRSSAGSGKTFTLVKEYLRLSLSTTKPDAYRAILAITFTNKASEEMKSRVIEVLDVLADQKMKRHDMADILEKELGLTPEDLAIRARQTLRHMLHHYSDISISTIDHFTHGLIRSFAQDLELSVNFEVELDSDRISREVVTGILSKVGNDKVLTKALINVLDQQLEGEKTWSISKTLQKFSKGLFSEESRFHLEKLKDIDLTEFNRLKKTLQSKINEIKSRITTEAKTALQNLHENSISDNELAYGARGIYPLLKKLAAGNLTHPSDTMLKLRENSSWAKKTVSDADKATIESIAPKINSAVDIAVELTPQFSYLQIISENLYAVALLDEMLRMQQQLQEDEEILHIGQFNHLVSEVVMKETAPFIYERIGNRYRHFLVDEFQDTSVLQWFNLLPLIDESLSQGNLCLVVGDAKQSIYRWRGGDVNQFIKLPSIYRTDFLEEKLQSEPEINQLMHQREAAIESQHLVDNLSSNYRSASNVVSFNNELFEGLNSKMDAKTQDIYKNSLQEIKKDEQGLVSIKFFEKPVADNQTWPEYNDITLEYVEHCIRECLEDDFLPGDIAVILRSNKDAVSVAQYLVEKGYKVVSNESLLINSSPAVRTVVNLATWLSFPEDHVNLVELIQNLGLIREEGDLTPTRLNRLGKKANPEALELLNELFPETDWKKLKQASLFGLFEQLHFKLGSSPEDIYCNFFLDEVLSYSKSQSDGVHGFLEYWNDKRHKLSIAMPENNDAIRIMTIHKSKGLEFPVVIHPFADYPTNNFGNDVWAYMENEDLSPLDRIRIKTSKKLENTPFEKYQSEEKALKEMDMFNELYVAYTRPRFRLYSSGWISMKGSTNTAIQYVYSQLAEHKPSVAEEKVFERGIREKNTKQLTEPELFSIKHHGNPNWSERISISRPSKDRWKTANESDARNLGILIHEAMAYIETKNDVPKAISILVQDGRLSTKDSLELQSRIEALFHKTELNPLFNSSSTIRNEAEIQLKSGKWLRPDRIAFNNDEAWVLDYKTGKQESKHKQQIENYKEALRQLGFKHVEGVLVYVNDGAVVSV